MRILSVRSILAFALVSASIALAFEGVLAADKVYELAVVVVAFYFGTRNERNPPPA